MKPIKAIAITICAAVIGLGQNIKISQLPSTGSVSGSEVLPIVQSGVTKQVSINTIMARAGSVSNVGMTVPSALLGVSGSPITTTGTFTITLPTRAPNLVFAGPTTGSAAAPTFRALVPADIPLNLTLGTPVSGNASNLSNIPITLTTSGSSGAATYTQSTNTLNIPQYSGGGGGSVFTGSTASTVASSATPVFSLSDISVKSPTLFTISPVVNVTAPTITNKSAGARFAIMVTTDGTHTWSWNSIVADNACAIYTDAAATTEAFLSIDPDGSTVHGEGCLTRIGGVIAIGATVSAPSVTPSVMGNMDCRLTAKAIDCLDSSSVHWGMLQFGSTHPFSGLPTCSSTVEGYLRPVSDSTTVTWGATITGSGSNHVQAYCDGTNWTVAAK